MPKHSTGKPEGAARAQSQAAKLTVTLVADSKPLQLVDGVRDPIRLLHQGLCSVVRVAQCDDAGMALKAGTWLVEYATVQLKLREEQKQAAEERRRSATPLLAPPEDRQTILTELRGLYRKALGESPLIVEAEPAEPEPKS